MSIFDENNAIYKEVIKYGKIIVDVDIPQVNTRILNVTYNEKIYYFRVMNGECYDIVNLSDDNEYTRIVDYNYVSSRIDTYPS